MSEPTILDEGAVSEIEALSTETSLDYAEVDRVMRMVPALCATVKHLRNELRRWQNGDVLPNGWTGLDAGDGFPNLYLYSRSDIVEQAKQRLTDLQSQLEQLRAENEQLKKHVADLNHDLEAAIKECNDHHG